jgi:hypothetical protein
MFRYRTNDSHHTPPIYLQWSHSTAADRLAAGAKVLSADPSGPGASQPVRVRFTEPAHGDGLMTIGLRWEATGMTGGRAPMMTKLVTRPCGSC